MHYVDCGQVSAVEDRLCLGNGKKNKIFFAIPLGLHYVDCGQVSAVEDRLRLGNGKKIKIFFAIPLGLHYLCMFKAILNRVS